MKIVTYSLDQIAGLDVLSSTILVLFFLLFLWIVYRIYKTSKSDIDRWEKLPLETDNPTDNSKSNNSY